VLISEIVDDRGYTILHEACFHNHERIARFIITVGQRTLKAMELTSFCNYRTEQDGFTALHFCSFKGNVQLSKLLIE